MHNKNVSKKDNQCNNKLKVIIVKNNNLSLENFNLL